MRTKTVIFVLLFAFIFVMADTSLPLFKENDNGRAQNDSLSVGDTVSSDSVPADSTDKSGEPDTTNMDSLQLAIYHHNKQVDDSIRLDSINRKKSGALDAPVTFSSEDSMVYDAKSKVARLYGNSNVKYQNMDLSSDRIQMSLDSSLVRATGTADSTGAISGTPVFTMGQDKYESDTMAFNFKTKKGFIYNVYTEQEDGYLSSQHSKRDSSGVLYLEHGRYTTCDQPHPDFYIALSRAKVRPGKDVVFGPAYLVVADVPLPLAIPYGFFPFTKSYSSGFIMPSYGDESSRGFYLRDGGYYFAMSDKWDLKLLGENLHKGDRGDCRWQATTASATAITEASSSATRTPRTATRVCPTIPNRPASSCSGVIVRILSQTHSAASRQASTSHLRAMSATTSTVCIIRRATRRVCEHQASTGAHRSRALV